MTPKTARAANVHMSRTVGVMHVGFMHVGLSTPIYNNVFVAWVLQTPVTINIWTRSDAL